ncbi:MAG TPA: DUF2079 domain-containing protein [Ktedonobacterales bacterium]
MRRGARAHPVRRPIRSVQRGALAAVPTELPPATGGVPTAGASARALLVARAGHLRAALATVAGQRRLAWALTCLLIALDCFIIGQRALVTHWAYHSQAFDLGNMDQAVWNTLHGQPFRFTNRGIDWYGPPTRLGIHVEPILFLIAPLYLIHSGAETLIVLQTVALALGALPLLALALRRLPDVPLLGVVFVVAYLATPEILGEALWGFHPVTLATPLLLAAIFALDLRRYGWFLLAGVLAAMTKEDVALALVPLGLLIAVSHRRPRLGIAVMVGSVAWTALCFLVIIPHFNGGASAAGNAFWYRYTQLGNSPGAAIRNLLLHPWLLVPVIVTPGKLAYLGLLLLTGGALGLFAPFWWLAALPELAINLLSAQVPQYSGFYQYNAIILPVALAAAVYGVAAWRAARASVLAGEPGDDLAMERAATPNGWPRAVLAYARRVRRWWRRLIGRIPLAPRRIAPLVAVWLLVATAINLVIIQPKLSGFWQAGAGPAPHQAQIAALLARIPPTALVAATDTLDPHLTDRVTIYLMPDPLSYQAEYVAADLATAAAPAKAGDAVMLQAMLASGHYRVLGKVDAVIVLRRTGPPLTPPPAPASSPIP